MPATSAKQKRLMDAAAHNPAFAKKVGIPSKVAKEFSKESKGMKFQKGGNMKGESPIQKKAKGTAKEVKMAAGGMKKRMPKADEMGGMDMKKGGKVAKYAKGGSIDGCAMKGKTKGTMISMKGSK